MIYFRDISQDDCIKTSHKPTTTGYGRITVGGKTYLEHRWAYIQRYHEIPKNHEIHHLCENKSCINPEHLVAMTVEEHRGLHTKPAAKEFYDALSTCKYGHPLDGRNLKQRFCKTCHSIRNIAYRNKPTIQKKQKDYYKINAEKIKARVSANYYKQKELTNVVH